MIFNIQKCSIHDGNGLRTLVFFKGCPLKCMWCANPESQSFEPEIMESLIKCIDCGKCSEICPENAIPSDKEGHLIDRSICTKCFRCTEICYSGAKSISGRVYPVNDLFDEIEKDRIFYSFHGGGVTFSGGEPLSFPDYLTEIAKMCCENGINVVIESCGYGDIEQFQKALPYVDHIFVDIKHIDSAIHKKLTGKDNKLILKNIRRIAEFGIPITIRTPVVPDLTDSAENIRGIAEYIRSVPGIREYELLIYHKLGVVKYKALGRTYELKKTDSTSVKKMDELVKTAAGILKNIGVDCFYILDNTKRR